MENLINTNNNKQIKKLINFICYQFVVHIRLYLDSLNGVLLNYLVFSFKFQRWQHALVGVKGVTHRYRVEDTNNLGKSHFIAFTHGSSLLYV